MKTLLWREFRWNRLIIVMGTAILVLPYVMMLSVVLWPGVVFQRGYLGAAAVSSYLLSQLTVAFLGGNAFAGERADRSAEFLCYLPISRTQRLVSKLCFAAIVIAVIWGVNLMVFRVDYGKFPWQSPFAREPFAVKYLVITGLVMFGMGWLISSFQSSPIFAISGAIAVPMLTLVGLSLTASGFEIEDEQFLPTWYSVISITLGTLGLALGTWLFLKRVEP